MAFKVVEVPMPCNRQTFDLEFALYSQYQQQIHKEKAPVQPMACVHTASSLASCALSLGAWASMPLAP